MSDNNVVPTAQATPTAPAPTVANAPTAAKKESFGHKLLHGLENTGKVAAEVALTGVEVLAQVEADRV